MITTPQKILVPTDFSTCGDAAVEYAGSLAANWQARLVIVHVQEHPLAYAGEYFYGPIDPDTTAIETMLREVKPTGDIPCEYHLLDGNPADAVVDCAKNENVDLIVLGTHGRTGLSRLVMGSVAEKIVRNAHCPVLTVKSPQVALAAKGD